MSMASTTNEVDIGSTIVSVLSSLNQAQLKGTFRVHVFGLLCFNSLSAVQHSPSIPLQILAGPGSGKTKVFSQLMVHIALFICVP